MDKIKNHIGKEYVNEPDKLYSKNSLKTEFEIVDITSGFIAFKYKNEIWIEFYIFQFCQGDDEDTLATLVWYGDGPSASLRELRHSYFPEYVFYLDLGLMTDAIEWLQSHYD